jgi:hypothetical protein
MDSGKKFIEAFDVGLLAHPDMAPYADEEAFYGRLKDHLYNAVRRELHLGEVIPVEVQEILAQVVPHSHIKAKAGNLLKMVEEQIVDPAFLKDSLADLLDVCSASMETYFHAYMEQLESPAAEDAPVELDTAYGKALVGLLRIIDPKLVNINLIKFMEWFLGREKMLTGDDRLTRLLAELTQVSVEESMGDNVNAWIRYVVIQVRAKLFDAHGNYIERPSFISHEEWERLKAVPENRAQLSDVDSPLMRQIKSGFESTVHKRFRGSCVRMMQAVAVATLVFEQHLLTPRQIAKTESSGRFKRFVASVSSKLITLPLVRIIIEMFHRAAIWIRVGIAKMLGFGAGISLAHRASLFFESRAPSLLYRQLLLDALGRLKIASSEEGASMLGQREASETAPLVEIPQQ